MKRRKWVHRWLGWLVIERTYGYEAAGFKGWLEIPVIRYTVAFVTTEGELVYEW